MTYQEDEAYMEVVKVLMGHLEFALRKALSCRYLETTCQSAASLRLYLLKN